MSALAAARRPARRDIGARSAELIRDGRVVLTVSVVLELEVDRDEFVLARITSTCARRRCRIETLRFSADAALAEITVSGQLRQIRQLQLWLGRVLSVRSVTCASVPSQRSTPAGGGERF